ncbi:Ser-Thr-rich glycosyl-phosphatidyl-inositol-anchored membrane family protein [compost metagenome]
MITEQVAHYLVQPNEEFKLPVGKNGDETFVLRQTHVMHPLLEAKYPEITTYKGHSQKDPARSITLTKTTSSIRAIIEDHGQVFRFEPSTSANGMYVYYLEDPMSVEQCGLSIHQKGDKTSTEINEGEVVKSTWPAAGYGSTHYQMNNLLIPLQGLYAVDQNITTVVDGLAFVANFAAALSAHYEMEIGIGFQLHPDNDQLIFLDASDPYPDYPTNVDSNFGGSNSFLSRNQVICDSMIGPANYNLSVLVCRTSVARGSYTAPCSMSGNKAKITCYGSFHNISHEVGHGFTCPHTYALAPADGLSDYITCLESSVMGHGAGIGAGYYFYSTSVETLAGWAIAGNHLTCTVQTPSGNAVPQITTSVDGKYMPANTPFVLTNTTATDADNDPLLYTWQSTDGYQVQYPDSSFNNPTDYLIFSSEVPSLNGNTRYVPFLSNLVSGEDDPYSHLPWITRDMHVRCLVRDSVGGVNMTFETVHIDGNSGPFKVNSPVLGDVVTELQPITITWDVANTTAAPVSAANVEILLSTDGGVTFPVVLTASTPNDGSQAVMIPNGTATNDARIMVKGNGIFFNINPAPFRIYDNASQPDFAFFAYDTSAYACSASSSCEFIGQALGSYSNPITFSVSGLPSGVTSNFPQTINPGQHVTLNLSGITTALRGKHPLTITYTSNSIVKDTTITLVVAGDIQTTNNYAVSALSTSSTSVRYSIPDLSWNPTEYTIEYWVKFDPTAMGVNSNTFYFGGSANNVLRKNANDKFFFRYADASISVTSLTSNVVAVSNRWYHVAVTFKNRTIKLYVDGILQASNTPNQIPIVWSSVSLGYSGTQGICGQFEEFRIWRYARSEKEIREHMHLNLSPDDVCSGEVELYLQFDQNPAAVVDVSGNHTVTGVNSPLSVVSDCPTAAGVSVTKTVEATGTISFDDPSKDTGMDITFNANPDGDVVAYKLLSIPNGTQPSFIDLNENAFWIVRNFGDTSLQYDAEIAINDAFNVTPTAGNYSIKQRPLFYTTGNWGSSVAGASFASGTVTFSGFDKFGHFSYGIDNDLSVFENMDQDWVLYPNPADSKVILVFENASDRKVSIENVLGEKIVDYQILEAQKELDINQLSSGVYYVRIFENGKQLLKKLVIQRTK